MSATHKEYSKEFKFNDYVYVEMVMGIPDEKRSGRLVQVRKGCGQFGSNKYMLRLRDNSLMCFENVMIRKVDDREFEEAFYTMNGRNPPVIPDQPVYEEDSESCTYYINDEWPETGFIIEKPSEPETPGVMSMSISNNKTILHI